MTIRRDAASGFGYSSIRNAGFHQGADVMTPVTGSAVSAADEGKVVGVGESKSLGKYVLLEHSDASGSAVSYTLYGHLGATSVSYGQQVDAGVRIGQSGTTGNVCSRTLRGTTSCAPQHVHFEIRTRRAPRTPMGDRCDPVRALAGSGTSCDGADVRGGIDEPK